MGTATSYRGLEDSRFEGISKAKQEVIFRQLIHERDGGCCVLCGGPVELDNMHLDHKIPRVRNGPDDASNMQVTHWRCNFKKRDRDITSTELIEDTPFKKQVSVPSVIHENAEVEEIISLSAAAKRLGISRQSMLNAIKAGKVPVIAVLSNRQILRLSDVDNYKPRAKNGTRKKPMSIRHYVSTDGPTINIETAAELVEAIDLLHTQAIDAELPPEYLRVLEKAHEEAHELLAAWEAEE